MPLHTDPALSARRRPLKPLLARALTGEPWAVALRDAGATPPAVAAACAVSYISRRHSRWWTIPSAALGKVLDRSVRQDRAKFQPGDWPFLDALEQLVPVTPWHDLDQLLEPYRRTASSDRSGGN